MEESRNVVTGSDVSSVVQVGRANTVNLHAALTRRTGPLGKPISDCFPHDLEVHSAGEGPLPPYIHRPHDEQVRGAVRAAAQGFSRFVVLIAGSSTGKTRACWEAVQQLPGRWTLWHPINPGRPEAVLADLDRIEPHTVVWLNETQHYLLTPGSDLGERVAAGLRELLRDRRPVLLLGTMWPEYWRALTRAPVPQQPDSHAQARALLVDVGVKVAEEFTAADVAAAAATGDERLVEAATQARDRQVTQYLAGAPALLERFHTASPAAAALITAAMDVRRLGHGLVMSPELLEDAVPGYLNDSQWNRLDDDWFATALADCLEPCRGGSSPLIRVRPRPGQPSVDGYRLEDYLEQTSRAARFAVAVPRTTWLSLLTNAAPEDRLMLAAAARVRGLYRIAYLFYVKANAPRHIGEMLDNCGRRDEAIDWYQRATTTGDHVATDVQAMRTHTERLISEGQFEEALEWLDNWAQTGARAAGQMADALRAKLGRRPSTLALSQPAEPREAMPDPESVVRAAAEFGDWSAVRSVVRALLADENREHAITWLRTLTIRHGVSPEHLIAVLRGGQHTQHPPAPKSAPLHLHEPADILARLDRADPQGNDSEFVQAFEEFRFIPIFLEQSDRLAEALEWSLRLTETGHGNRLDHAAHLLRRLGHDHDAQCLQRYGLDPGGRIASEWPR